MRKLVLFTILALVAVSAFAQMDGMQPVIAADGTIIVLRPSITSDDRMTTELVAVSPAGTQLWKFEAGATMHAVAVGGPRVFAVRSGMRMGGEEVVALSLATGAVQWRREISGAVMGIQWAADRVYLVTGSGGMK